MLSIVKSMALLGLEGYLIDVQVDVSAGMPSWDVVGLPDTSVKESKERVRTAIKNSEFDLPSRKIVINLAPADTRKEGSFFDLAISVGILCDLEKIECKNIEDYIFIGELSLDGKLNRVNGILPMCIEAKRLGIRRIVLPPENAREAAIVEGIEIYGVENLREVVEFLNGEKKLEPEKLEFSEVFKENAKYDFDFSEVKGQENVKRALEIAAAGGHNCLLIGSPGSGKTMMARRIPSILPDLSFDEALEITKIHSIAGNLKKDCPIIVTRPFRAPHHTVSGVSLVGRWKNPETR